MDDLAILSLYLARDEAAIAQTGKNMEAIAAASLPRFYVTGKI